MLLAILFLLNIVLEVLGKKWLPPIFRYLLRCLIFFVFLFYLYGVLQFVLGTTLSFILVVVSAILFVQTIIKQYKSEMINKSNFDKEIDDIGKPDDQLEE